jgi:hypothetical protein
MEKSLSSRSEDISGIYDDFKEKMELERKRYYFHFEFFLLADRIQKRAPDKYFEAVDDSSTEPASFLGTLNSKFLNGLGAAVWDFIKLWRIRSCLSRRFFPHLIRPNPMKSKPQYRG